MSVDYDAVFGIGVEVEAIDDGNYDTDLEDKLYNILDESKLYRFSSAGNHFNGIPKYYIFLKDSFDNGYDITEKVRDFCSWLKDNKIVYKGRVDVCGDSRVW